MGGWKRCHVGRVAKKYTNQFIDSARRMEKITAEMTLGTMEVTHRDLPRACFAIAGQGVLFGYLFCRIQQVTNKWVVPLGVF